jgi:cation diffusion facilitator CzcD-associated flavoprotein CzcO
VPTEELDVLVVGAGISGIDAAYHLQTHCPDRTFAVLEGRGDLGGTWDLFRYPGVRSDSDMHTLGFEFKPWTDAKAIADGPSIMAYLRETVAEFGLERHLRFHHAVRRASWSSELERWTVEVDRGDTGATETFLARHLFMCSGYYSYRHGYTPTFPGVDRFTGRVVHPQQWPEDLDVTGQRVVVIGSGATAVTLVPALAERAAHVTMLQRSPTWVVSRPDEDVIANGLRRLLPDQLAYRVTRRKNVALQRMVYHRSRVAPARLRNQLLKLVRKQLGPEYDVDTHFNPTYDPWDQRLCLIPNGDLFEAIKAGTASVVTDRIETFTERGVLLASGTELEADVVVTATGLQLVTLGEVDFDVDGTPVDFSSTFTYKGLAYSDVPNLYSCFGYIAASWTLRADQVCHYVCRLLEHLAASGTTVCTPRLRPQDRDMPRRPYIDDFSSGYVQRAIPLLPKQGDREPWVHPQDLRADRRMLRQAVDDGVMRFTGRATASSTAA